jgi:hypothetical protein
MHMIDVMKKLQEIAEDGYDNEDIQRGIDAASKHTVAEAQSPAQKAAFQKMLDAKKGDKPEAEDDDENLLIGNRLKKNRGAKHCRPGMLKKAIPMIGNRLKMKKAPSRAMTMMIKMI